MTSKDLKKQGQAIALANSGKAWVLTMLSNLQAFCKVRKDMGEPEFKLEEFRAVADQMNWPQPKTANGWGALVNAAISRNIITFANRFDTAKRLSAHGRIVRVWMAV